MISSIQEFLPSAYLMTLNVSENITNSQYKNKKQLYPQVPVQISKLRLWYFFFVTTVKYALMTPVDDTASSNPKLEFEGHQSLILAAPLNIPLVSDNRSTPGRSPSHLCGRQEKLLREFEEEGSEPEALCFMVSQIVAFRLLPRFWVATSATFVGFVSKLEYKCASDMSCVSQPLNCSFPTLR